MRHCSSVPTKWSFFWASCGTFICESLQLIHNSRVRYEEVLVLYILSFPSLTLYFSMIAILAPLSIGSLSKIL